MGYAQLGGGTVVFEEVASHLWGEGAWVLEAECLVEFVEGRRGGGEAWLRGLYWFLEEFLSHQSCSDMPFTC